MKQNKFLLHEQVLSAVKESFKKLNPTLLYRNPIMFTVFISTIIMGCVSMGVAFNSGSGQGSFGYNFTIFIVLFITLLFANFAEAIAEARGKAQAESLRKTRQDTPAKKREGGANNCHQQFHPS